jgi:hypothetical protein
MNMTWKPRSSHIGSIQHPQDPKKAQQVQSNVKVTLFFFGYRGVVHHEYAGLGQTVSEEYYQETLHHLRDAVQYKRLELLDARNWQLHHDWPSSFITPDPAFLAKHAFRGFIRLPTRLTWFLVISGCSRD